MFLTVEVTSNLYLMSLLRPSNFETRFDELYVRFLHTEIFRMSNFSNMGGQNLSQVERILSLIP